MDKIKLGIIGIGAQGSGYAKHLIGGAAPEISLTAVCDSDHAKLEAFKKEYGDNVHTFNNYKDLIKSGEVDSVLIAVPHYDHCKIAVDAFSEGLNVLVEKPAGVFTEDVESMNAAAEKSGKVFSIMYNQRTNPVYIKVRQLVKSGQLGDIKRVSWIITDWYRPQAYHDSSDWRSKWSTEGGGVLINQCPHNIDLMQWICGVPVSIRAFMSFGRYHNIEVEDDVTAYYVYENGATGTFIASTGETPGTNRLEIAGDMGKIVVEQGLAGGRGRNITFYENSVSEREFEKTNTIRMGKPVFSTLEIETPQMQVGQHIVIMNNFAAAILRGEKLISPGEEGIIGLSISNAMHLSAWTGEEIKLPIDSGRFYEELQKRVK